MQIKGLPCDLKPGGGEVGQTVPEQVIVIGLEPDLGTLVHQAAILQKLARVGQAVLVAAGILAPRVAEIDVDARNAVLRREGVAQPLNVQTGNLYIVGGQAALSVGGLDLALGEDQHLVGDVDAQIVDVGVGWCDLGEKATLAAAQLKVPRLVGPGVQLMPVAAVGQRLVNMEIAGQQLRPGIGFETHAHGRCLLI